jgi:hypothetical protein
LCFVVCVCVCFVLWWVVSVGGCLLVLWGGVEDRGRPVVVAMLSVVFCGVVVDQWMETTPSHTQLPHPPSPISLPSTPTRTRSRVGSHSNAKSARRQRGSAGAACRLGRRRRGAASAGRADWTGGGGGDDGGGWWLLLVVCSSRRRRVAVCVFVSFCVLGGWVGEEGGRSITRDETAFVGPY